MRRGPPQRQVESRCRASRLTRLDTSPLHGPGLCADRYDGTVESAGLAGVLTSRRRALAAALATLCLTVAVAAAPADARTVVSLTFDDGQATQYQVRKPLRRHGM